MRNRLVGANRVGDEFQLGGGGSLRCDRSNFAERLLRLQYHLTARPRLVQTARRPRAVLVAWDTLDEPTYRHRALAEYQSIRTYNNGVDISSAALKRS